MLDLEAEEIRKQKAEEELEKEKYRENVRINMIKMEEERKKTINDKRKEQDYKLMSVQQRKEEELRYKKELEYLKRHDRQETVDRIMRIQQYERERVMEKIQGDDIRTQQLKEEKQGLLAARF